MTNWEEKRKHKRAYLKLVVEYRSKNFWQMIEARDISAGGMFVIADKLEPAQTKVEIMFKFGNDNKKVIMAEGVVAWCRNKPAKDEKGQLQAAGMGITFTKIMPSAAKAYIEELAKSESLPATGRGG